MYLSFIRRISYITKNCFGGVYSTRPRRDATLAMLNLLNRYSKIVYFHYMHIFRPVYVLHSNTRFTALLNDLVAQISR